VTISGPEAEHTFNGAPTIARALTFFPHVLRVHVGDSVNFRVTA
jgi:hypothetical protein